MTAAPEALLVGIVSVHTFYYTLLRSFMNFFSQT